MSDLMREQFEKKYKAPAGCRWNSMTEEYGQSWDELSGDDDIEKEIRIHNDRLLVWKASRECLVIELPKPCAWDNDGGFDRESDPDSECSMALIPKIDVMQSIHAAGVKTK